MVIHVAHCGGYTVEVGTRRVQHLFLTLPQQHRPVSPSKVHKLEPPSLPRTTVQFQKLRKQHLFLFWQRVVLAKGGGGVLSLQGVHNKVRVQCTTKAVADQMS